MERRRKQPNEMINRRLVSGPVIVSIGTDRFLCCLSASFPQDGAQFTWSESIRIVLSSQGAVLLLDSSVVFMCALSTSKTSVSRNSATVSLRNNDNDDNNTIASVSTFQLPSSLLLSATIVYKSKLPLSTLQQACLKRQLVGFPIVFQEGELSTEINIHFHGQSICLLVAALISKRKGTIIYTIVPSTRITLLEKAEPIVNDCTTTPSILPPLSPTAQLLVDSARHIHLRTMPRSFLLTGPPGVGKTYSVKQAYAHMGGTLNVVQGSELLRDGHEADAAMQLKDIFLDAAAAATTNDIQWILLDECEALLSSDVVAAMLGYLLDQLDSSRIILVAATNRIDAIPAYLRRRMDREIAMEPPNEAERFSLLKMLCADEHLLHLPDIATACVGYVPADLTALVQRAKLSAVKSGSSISIQHIQLAMIQVPASALRDAALSAPPKTSWDDIAGDAGGAKVALRRAVEWPRLKRDAFQHLGLNPPRGILLHGPPGCAKTSLARAAAGASGISFFALSPADVYASSYVGEAEAVVRRAFTIARSAAPCILFFDEIDSILGSGGGMHRSGGTSAEARVLSTFLNEMDGVDVSVTDGVLVLGATNRPSQLDAALLRPGRFDNVIYVPPPDEQGRRAIIEMFCQTWKCPSFDLDMLSSDKVSGMMTGAEVVGACRDAAMTVLKENLLDVRKVPIVTQLHLETALSACQPLLSDPAVLEEYTRFDKIRSR